MKRKCKWPTGEEKVVSRLTQLLGETRGRACGTINETSDYFFFIPFGGPIFGRTLCATALSDRWRRPTAAGPFLSVHSSTSPSPCPLKDRDTKQCFGGPVPDIHDVVVVTLG